MKITHFLWSVAAALGFLIGSADAQVLLRDDFNGTSLDAAKWSVADWKLGRAQLALTPVVADGFARLKFETFNPKSAGVTFVGTEIDSKQDFSLMSGIEFEARMRVGASPAGLVTSFFTYKARRVDAENFSDEIDFEFLSNQMTEPPPGGTPIQLTTYRAFNNTRPNYEDASRINGQSVRVARINLNRFNTFVIRWLPNRVEWLVNGRTVRVAQTAVPEEAMKICLNFWAPEKSWVEAFSDSLVPEKTAAKNRVFHYDVDYVEVRRISGR